MTTALIVLVSLLGAGLFIFIGVYLWDEYHYRQYAKNHPDRGQSLAGLMNSSMPQTPPVPPNDLVIWKQLRDAGLDQKQALELLDQWKGAGIVTDDALMLAQQAAKNHGLPTCPKCDKRPISPPDYICAECRITPAP